MADKIDGVTFGGTHSYNDLKLILVNRPTIKPGKAKTVNISIPGRDGTIDVTEKLFGKIPQNNTTLTFDFMSNQLISGKTWAALYEQVKDTLHCKRLKIVMDEQPGKEYTGIVQVSSFKCAKGRYDISVTCDCDTIKNVV